MLFRSGQRLFQYTAEDGELHEVTSSDVNDYLREITGRDVTAKDFRTWAGTVMAAMALQEVEKVETQAALKKNVKAAIEQVSARLGNTPTICRKCYVHPEVLQALLPTYALGYIAQHGIQSFALASSVILAVTGAEALYADMGHFGRRPIRLAWGFLVGPALVL